MTDKETIDEFIELPKEARKETLSYHLNELVRIAWVEPIIIPLLKLLTWLANQLTVFILKMQGKDIDNGT